MHAIELKILMVFKKEPQREFHTTEIVKAAFEKEYAYIKEVLHAEHPDPAEKRRAMEQKGELHRRILYHLNKLVHDEILKVSRVESRGEKQFVLALDPGEYIIEKRQHKVLIAKPEIPNVPIDTYEEKRIIRKYDKEGWVSRLNAILIQAEHKSELLGLHHLISKVFSSVNDAVGLNNMEQLISKNTPESLGQFLAKLNVDTQDYNKELTLTIDCTNIADQMRVIEFIELYARLNPEKVHIVFSLDPHELQKCRRVIERAVTLFSGQKRKVNIQNRQLHPAPFMIGKAGAYTFNSQEYEFLQKERLNAQMLVCSQVSLLVDVFRFYKNYASPQEFRSMIIKAAKTVLISNRIQRTNAQSYFAELNRLAEPYSDAFYFLGQNYIRFWNYDLDRPEQKHFIELLESCKEEVGKFCATEETIYKSCGIPIRFRIGFSSKFSRYDQEFFSQMTYIKSTIRKTKDLEKAEIRRFIEEREQLVKVFDSADRVRFFRAGEFRPGDIIHEFSRILTTGELPFFCYDFSERRGDLTLAQFME